MFGINVKLFVGLLALATASTIGSHKLGYDKGDEAGFARASDICAKNKADETIIRLSAQNRAQEESLAKAAEVTEAIQLAAKDAERLNRRIGEIREKSNFTSSGDNCRWSDDELRYIQEAYRLLAADRDGGSTG